MSPMNTTQSNATRRPLPGSLFFIFTGQGNNGKTEQMMRLMSSRWPDGTPAIAPFLLLVCEASTEGTAGPIIDDESMCLVWPVADFEEAKAVLAAVFPEGKPPLTLREARSHWQRFDIGKAVAARKPSHHPTLHDLPTDHLPIGGVAVESASTLLRAQKTAVREAARDRHKGKVSVDGHDLDNDQKRIAAMATGPAQDFVDALSGVSVRNRGVVVCVSVHTRAQIQAMKAEGSKEVKEIAVGEAPDFGAPKVLDAGKKVTPYADLWMTLHAKANVVWHLYGDAPDFSNEPDLSN